MNLIGYKIRAIEYWKNNGHISPTCSLCKAPVHWGGGFILKDLKLTCNRCIETIFTSPHREVMWMVQKKKAILEAYKDRKASFLDALTLLIALEKQGFKMTRRGLSNFIRNSLENKYLVPSRDVNGTIIGWTLIRYI